MADNIPETSLAYRSLKTQIGIAFLLLLIAPILIGIVAAISLHDKVLREKADIQIRSQMQQALQIHRELEREMVHLAQIYARRKVLFLLLPLRMGDKIGRELQQTCRSDGLDMLTVVDTHLQVVARAHAPDALNDFIPAKPFFQKVGMGDAVAFLETLSNAELDAEHVPKHLIPEFPLTNQALCLSAVAPIQPIAQEPPIGFVIIRRLLSLRQSPTRLIAHTLHVNSALFFRNKRIVTTLSPKFDPPFVPPSEDSLNQVMLSNETVVQSLFTENGHVTVLAPLANDSGEPVAVLMIQSPITALIQTRNRAWTVLVAVGVISGVLIFCLLKTIENRVISPIQRLRRSIDALPQHIGDTQTEALPVLHHNEIGELTRSFNRMAKTLRDTLDRLERENLRRKRSEEALLITVETMEQQIRERTSHIARINETLKAEIAERKRTEIQYQSSLEEKEVLLREIHHRVKNNLQIISSLLDMTRNRSSDPTVIEALTGARNKIYAMSLINTQLYQSDRFDNIDMQAFIQNLSSSIRALASPFRNIAYRIHAENVFLSITHANPIAIILNEILSNCLKHAFAENQPGIVDISMQQDKNQNVLVVSDNGKGMPADIEIASANTLGLKLVRNLVSLQLKGTLEIQGNPGTTVTITFPRVKAASSEIRS
ncbi:sensor histidine kinase [Desulfatirhabdium butyrativorans]|uniref:sensor histidine kinase n=1 Tax=Desulfatirhabdium butyrativorans TaxID=340467 RepID=UPI0003FEF9C1|nr:sensor histidine kinase [Desulfatirhabdium butyrativorans]